MIYVVTVIYEDGHPIAYETAASSRKEALDEAWNKYDQVRDYIKKIVAVRK